MDTSRENASQIDLDRMIQRLRNDQATEVAFHDAVADALAAERDRADRAEARLGLVRDEASAYRQAGKSDMAPVASVGVLLLALIDGGATA